MIYLRPNIFYHLNWLAPILTGTKLPEYITTFAVLDTAKGLIESGAKVFLTFLGLVSYVSLTLLTTKDIEFITNQHPTKLPLINIEVPIVGFYILLPLWASHYAG